MCTKVWTSARESCVPRIPIQMERPDLQQSLSETGSRTWRGPENASSGLPASHLYRNSNRGPDWESPSDKPKNWHTGIRKRYCRVLLDTLLWPKEELTWKSTNIWWSMALVVGSRWKSKLLDQQSPWFTTRKMWEPSLRSTLLDISSKIFRWSYLDKISRANSFPSISPAF